MKNIAVDIDDVLGDFVSNFVLFHNNKYGTKLKKENFFSYQYPMVLGVSEQETIYRIDSFYVSDYFKEIIPISGSIETISSLKKLGHNLFIVTGRKYSLVQETIEWVSKNFEGMFSDIYHTNSYHSEGEKIKKSKVCLDLNASIIIDDDLMHIKDCSLNGIKVLVYDNPWNREILPERAVRVFNWNEILKKLTI
ncbi:hypothetical protein COX93_00075 [Candidatus Nomurabacteria bacterium CG_4_10_14_0_2_um_filter_30_12]|uniref:Nucleotidase n=2 Tax=Candidatus Nomuraibacteriota TaxID=1752729 RepID=A0A2J0MHU7_9BACT|nr:MAG: hypothetical protein COU48_01255 [Candidatus Nomurabacteria bacterium CG10_big_fil_rev_8_21_14_0_10_03_31_7]PIZ87760.1 MAG: hypothetical protein COX93_00075 [Candidatus Nomurabacteria bacterium CG_4_10_14_0_2_um_filter_30_12]